MIEVREKKATHYCNQCGALWATLPPMVGLPDGGWTLVSNTCGRCCDNAPMAGQILPIAEDA